MIWLLACTNPAIESVPIQGGGDRERQEVQRALDDFAQWTGRRSMALGEVVLQEQVELERQGKVHPVRGQYEMGVIYLTSNDPELYKTTLHELCHALDTSEHLSQRLSPDLLPPSPLYPTPGLRQREAYARACAELATPTPELELALALTQTCQRSYLTPLQAYAYTTTFPNHPIPPLPQSTTRLTQTTEPLPVPIGDRLLSLTSSTAGPLLLVERGGLFVPDTTTGRSVQDALSLYQIEPATRVLTALPLPRDILEGSAEITMDGLYYQSPTGPQLWPLPLTMADAADWEDPVDLRWVADPLGQSAVVINGSMGLILPENGCQPPALPEQAATLESQGRHLGIWPDPAGAGLLIGEISIE